MGSRILRFLNAFMQDLTLCVLLFFAFIQFSRGDGDAATAYFVRDSALSVTCRN